MTSPDRSTAFVDWVPGKHVLWGNRIVQFQRLAPGSLAIVADLATGNMLSVPRDALTPTPALQTVRVDPGTARPTEWEFFTAVAQDLEPYAEHARLPTAITQALASKHGKSTRQIQRYRHAYQAFRRASALLPGTRGRRAGTGMIDARTERVIEHAYRKWHLRREPISQRELIERIGMLCRRVRCPVPAASTVHRRIKAWRSAASDVLTMGAKRAYTKWKATPGELHVDRPLALCQIDHAHVDLLVLSDDRREVLGRPWLTVAIDVATRCILGIYLTMDSPSSVSVAMCITHATLPKLEENTERPDRWPMYGKPWVILTDNAKEFRSQALEQGCEEHGIELRFRPPGTPHYGGHVERVIGTLMRGLKSLRGTTFSNVRERADYPSEERATLTLGELREWFVNRICNHYHVRRHRSLGIPPLVAWERAFTAKDGNLLAPPMMAAPEQFRVDFYPCVLRQVRKDGVTHRSSRYWHPSLAALVGREASVLIRYHPKENTAIWWRDADGVLIEARAIAGPGRRTPPAPLSDAEDARTQALLDEGYTRADDLADNALQAVVSEKARRPRPPRKRKKSARARPTSTTPTGQQPPSPDRGSVTTQEID